MAALKSMQDKQALREQLLLLRRQISLDRRREASEKACTFLSQLNLKGNVLSFSSQTLEIDLGAWNRSLALSQQLCLPRVEGDSLKIYRVADLKFLQKSKWGIGEPIPEKCLEIKAEDLAVVCVPGLGFDAAHHRIGYGKAYYDRFLRRLPSFVATFGVGFKEQKLSFSLPIENHDISLTKLFLF